MPINFGFFKKYYWCCEVKGPRHFWIR